MSSANRPRIVYAALTAIIILIGLTVHTRGAVLGDPVRDILGDALWASMIAAGLSAMVPRQPAARRYVTAVLICYAVETSQLWHTPMLDRLRATPFGHLTLGSDFDPRDLVSYALGVLAFAWVDRGVMRSPRARV